MASHGVSLNLAKKGLTELSSLSLSENEKPEKIERLQLSSNEISHVDDQTISTFVNLQVLVLSNNQLTTIPGAIASTLRVLNLHNNSIDDSGCSYLSSLVHLRVLDLSNNAISTVPAEILRLSLVDVNLSNNIISGMSWDMFPSSVASIKLSGNGITTIGEQSAIKRLSNLERLNLDGNALEEMDASYFMQCTSLHYLNLKGWKSNNPQLQRQHTAVLAALIENLVVEEDDSVSQHAGSAPLLELASLSNVESLDSAVDKLVPRFASSINSTNGCGQTALHRACQNGFSYLATKLVIQGAMISMVDNYGYRPADYIGFRDVRSEDSGLSSLFADRESFKDEIEAVYDSTARPDHFIGLCWDGCSVAAKYLTLRQEAIDKFRKSSLHPSDFSMGSSQWQLWQRELATALRRWVQPKLTSQAETHSKEDTSLQDDVHVLPFHAAAASGDLEMMEALLQSSIVPNELVSSKDTGGSLPIHVAAAMGHSEVLQQLIDLGDRSMVNDFCKYETVDVEGVGRREVQMSALGIAIDTGHSDCIGVLLEKGADVLCVVRDPLPTAESSDGIMGVLENVTGRVDEATATARTYLSSMFFQTKSAANVLAGSRLKQGHMRRMKTKCCDGTLECKECNYATAKEVWELLDDNQTIRYLKYSFDVGHCLVRFAYYMLFLSMLMLSVADFDGARRDVYHLPLKRSLENHFEENILSFADISRPDDIYGLLYGSVKDALFYSTDGANSSLSTQLLIDGQFNYLMGSVRVRQQRSSNVACNGIFKDLLTEKDCVSELNMEMTDPFGDKTTPFTWWSEEALHTRPSSLASRWSGQYHGGGYLVDIPGDPAIWDDYVKFMESNDFFDRQTRVVFITANHFNVNSNVWVASSVMIEFPTSGGVVWDAGSKSIRLEWRVNAETVEQYWMIEIIIVLCVSAGIVSEIVELWTWGLDFFVNFWNMIDAATNAVFVCIGIIGASFTDELSKLYIAPEDHITFVAVDRLHWNQQRVNIGSGFFVLLAWLRVLKYCECLPKLGPQVYAVRSALVSTPVVVFFIFTIAVATAFIMAHYTSFAMSNESYYTLSAASDTIMRFVLVGGEFPEVDDFEVVHFTVMMVVLSILTFNVLIGILGNEYCVKLEISDDHWKKHQMERHIKGISPSGNLSVLRPWVLLEWFSKQKRSVARARKSQKIYVAPREDGAETVDMA